jgi:hypothetical protein
MLMAARRLVGRVRPAILMSLVVGCGGGDPTGTPPPGGDPPGDPPAADSTAPVARARLRSYDDSAVTAIGANVYLAQDSVFFDIEAEDDSLAWLGFAFTGAITARDSVAVPSGSGSLVGVHVTLIRPGVTGTVGVQAFARDGRGHLGTAVADGSPALLVATDTTFYPQIGGGAEEFAMDLRGVGGVRRAYWVNGRTIERADGSSEIGPELPAPPSSVDILANPDSVIATLPDLDAYAIVEMPMPPGPYPPITLLPDTITAVAGVPWALRTAANGHAIVHRRHPTDPHLDSWVDLDPVTGEQTLLSAVVVRDGRIERTIDHRRLVVWDTLCCGGQAQSFTAATGTWSAPVTVGITGRGRVSMDTAGTRLLAGTTLYALPDLTPLALFRPPHLAGGAVLSPDGDALIAVTPDAFLRVWRDNQAADQTWRSGYSTNAFLHLPDLNELMLPVLGEYGYFRAGVRLPARTHQVAAIVDTAAPGAAVRRAAWDTEARAVVRLAPVTVDARRVTR